MEIDLLELKKFLVEAKKRTYAGGGKEITPQRPDFIELEFRQGHWYYRDSYYGLFQAPGQEVVRFNGKPVWAMAYSGGMLPKYHGDEKFALKTFGFLKKVMLRVTENEPFRGPRRYSENDYEYVNELKGDVTNFVGTEKIFYKGKEVFRQHYHGGLIIQK